MRRGSRAEGGSPRSPGAAPDGHVRARRLRADRAGHHPAGRPVPRRGRRGPARAHLRLHRSRRRGAVPAPRPHRADLPAAPGAPSRAATSPARYCYSGPAFRYQPGGADQRAPDASSARPASNRSRRADREQDDAAVLALIVEALREAGLAQLRSCASATSACSPRCSTRCRCRSAGAGGCGIISGAPRRSAPSWRASPRATALQAHGRSARADGALDPARPQEAQALRRELPGAVRAGADRHAHAARDRRAPAGRGRRCARDAAGAGNGAR